MNDGRKKQGQKHQNKTAYKIQFDPLSQEIHKKVSFRGLCKRCKDQLEWKIQYNKYKKMTEPAKCTYCHNKNVLRTYMRACEACSESLKTCPKCLAPESEEDITTKLNEREEKTKQADDERKMNQFLKTLKERSRRTVKRLYEKNAINWSSQENNFLDEEGNVHPVHFRQGYNEKNSLDQGQNSEGEQISDNEGSEQQQQQVNSKSAKSAKSESKAPQNEKKTKDSKGKAKHKEGNVNQEGAKVCEGDEQQWEDVDETQNC